MKKISQLSKEATLEENKTPAQLKDQDIKEGKAAVLKPIHLSKVAGAMKDQYIKTLEEGYKPEDVKKYLTDMTKPNADPGKVKEPTPKMSSTETMEQDLATATSEIDMAL